MPDLAGKEYDFVIVGSGLGGLACGYILASEGHRVVILEKNHQIGGNLQVYSRDKTIFDTGVHYVGSMNEGENLNKFFRYFQIFDKLKLHRLDEDRFDVVRFDDGQEYDYPQGYEAFQKKMIGYFPEEETAILTYCSKIKEVCSKFPLYNLRVSGESYQTDQDLLQLNAYEYIASLTSNQRLRDVLAGSNQLYAGVKETTPFFAHALIINSYLSGAYKFTDGGSQIAILMSRKIREMGGEIYKHKNVTGATYNEAGYITHVELENGETVRGKQFISNVHPAVTIDIFGEERFLGVYRNRIRNLPNTISTFLVHISFKKNTFRYLNHNIYQHHTDGVWDGIEYDVESWPQTYFICTPHLSRSPEFAESMSIMTYMKSSETDEWAHTFKTVAAPGDRVTAYEDFKREKEQKVLTRIEQVFPGIREKINHVHSASPLTFRDYIGNPDGSLYGIAKNSENPARTQVNTKTRIPNLHLTGQNISMHGILGVTVSAFVTCFAFVDKNKLIQKVINA
ncbi:MAG TPA: NAD(P)/FAD-dependent oxidoreductase [Dyadobacter sp.]|jgi:all-trans-retinol 13,14-reductase|nr:NAD(P)/FAD-dependent oxidoreductase [Dyadobacter sp.]